MRIKATVLSVSSNGDELLLSAVGSCVGDADWRQERHLRLSVPDTDTYRKAMHVGRRLRIDVVAE